MDLSLNTIALEEKLVVVERMIVNMKRFGGGEGLTTDQTNQQFFALKSIAKDLKARLDRPRNLALGELERSINAAFKTKTALGYDNGSLIAVGNTLIRHWPFVRQALEHYGAESDE